VPEKCISGAIKTHSAIIAAVSRPASAVRSGVSSVPVLASRAAVVVVAAAVQAELLQQENCVGAANARSAEEFAAAELVRCGWAPT
jgi:hypothetical protein